MKKIISILVALMAIGMQNVSAQYAKIMLQHEGKATLFETTNLQGAIDASVDGDTIYVGEGPYNSQSVTIRKKITIIGQGVKSQLGDVTINLPGGSEMTSTILYGVKTGTVTISCSVSNLHIDKCTMSNLNIKPASSTSTQTYKMKDMLVERCKITNRAFFEESDKYENCIIRNCNIQYFSNWSKDISFNNCTLYSTYAMKDYYSSNAYSDYVWGNYINCIISRFLSRYGESSYRYGNYTIDNSTSFVNCLMGETPNAGSTTNIYVDSKTDYTDDELKVKNYLGTDGTIVGCNGGVRPFNLVPSVPSLEDIQMDVNYNTRKLNVTVKVKAN